MHARPRVCSSCKHAGAEGVEALAGPNVLIKEGTRLDPMALFPKPVEGIISKHRGFSSKWATKKGDSFDIVPGAPEAFFAEVLDLVRGLGGADRVGSGGAPLVTR